MAQRPCLVVFFLQAEAYVKSAGIKLAFAPLAEAAAVQARNVSSWALFPPMLDCRLSAIAPERSYGLIGYGEDGEVVCAQGGRIYETGDASLADIIADQSFFYGPGHEKGPEQPGCSITAPAAAHIKGRFVYSGALWVHPDYRGNRLAAILPRISRAYALAKWNTEYTIALVSHKIAASPLLQMYGYNRIEPDFRIWNLGPTAMTGCLMWMDQDELAADLASFMASNLAQIDSAIVDGRGQDQPASAANGNRRRQS